MAPAHSGSCWPLSPLSCCPHPIVPWTSGNVHPLPLPLGPEPSSRPADCPPGPMSSGSAPQPKQPGPGPRPCPKPTDPPQAFVAWPPEFTEGPPSRSPCLGRPRSGACPAPRSPRSPSADISPSPWPLSMEGSLAPPWLSSPAWDQHLRPSQSPGRSQALPSGPASPPATPQAGCPTSGSSRAPCSVLHGVRCPGPPHRV